MNIEYHLTENINGVKYKLDVFSVDGETFRVTENDKKEQVYHNREDFLKDFPELSWWFFPND